MQTFFSEAAVRYYAKTGKKVAVQYQDTIDYLGTIYDKTMQDDAFPDVYLLPGIIWRKHTSMVLFP